MDEETESKLQYVAKRCERQRKRFYALEPKAIGQVLARVVINNRYAAGESNTALADAWADIVGQAFAARTQPTGIKRGKFEVMVAHSAITQELTLDGPRILAALQKAFPETKITGLRYRVGTIG